jgi:ATP:ADP antiporter, AAA family
LAAAPTVAVFVVVQVARRVSNFAMARPAREVLFTSTSREDRYKAKNFIDTVVYRSGDQVGSWAYVGLVALGLNLTGVAIVAVPLSLAWLALGLWLGRRPRGDETTFLSNLSKNSTVLLTHTRNRT